jgi:hypothetical protein
VAIQYFQDKVRCSFGRSHDAVIVTIYDDCLAVAHRSVRHAVHLEVLDYSLD